MYLTNLFRAAGMLVAAAGTTSSGDGVEQLIKPSPFTIGFTIIFLIISIIIGIYATKKAKTAEQFFGGTKSFGPIVIGLASASAVMSAFGFIGGPGLVYKMGYTSLWITFCGSGAFAYSFYILGKRMRAMAEVIPVATLPDIARARFRSKTVQGLLALGLLLASIVYLSTQVKGGAYLIVQMIGVSQNTAVLILFGATLAYMVFSGMSGSILTDAFQGIVMLTGVIGVIAGFFAITGGNAMPVIQASENFGPRFVDGIGLAPLTFVITFTVVFFVGSLGQPQVLSKMYSLKNHNDLRKAGFISGIVYAITSLVWFLVGYGALYLVASGQSAPLKDADNAAFLFLSRLGGFSQALVMAALLAAIMSTASFFISLASSSVTRDLTSAFGRDVPHDKQVTWGRVLSIVMTLGAVLFGYWGENAVAILGTIGWGFFFSATIPVFLIGMLWKRATKEGAITGLITALVLNLVLTFMKNTGMLKLPFPEYLLAVALTAFLTVMVSLFTHTAGGDDLPDELKPVFRL